MNKHLIISIIVTIIIGSLLHFTYEWFHKNNFVALFSATNESTWEHLKLLFFPYLLCTLIELFLNKNISSNFVTSRTIGLMFGMFLIPTVFYLYTALLGNHYFIIDITLYIVAVFSSFLISDYLCTHTMLESNTLSTALLCLITICFFTFTFNPPELELFLDPITKSYGI